MFVTFFSGQTLQVHIVTILAKIALTGEHIFQVLGQYWWVLPQSLQVLSQYLRVLSRWIHPYFFGNSICKNGTFTKLLSNGDVLTVSRKNVFISHCRKTENLLSALTKTYFVKWKSNISWNENLQTISRFFFNLCSSNWQEILV